MLTVGDKRPRIKPDLAAEVDAARGMVPFEPFVNDLISRGLFNHPADAEEAMGYILDEHCAGDLKVFDALVTKVRNVVVEAQRDTAIEEEWDEDL